jgi:hypothetical protein
MMLGEPMSLPQLSVVPAATETPGARAMRLLAEARAAAGEQVHMLENTLATAADLAGQIAEGGDVYPVGVRDLCRRLSEDVLAKAHTLDAILQQHGTPRRR